MRKYITFSILKIVVCLLSVFVLINVNFPTSLSWFTSGLDNNDNNQITTGDWTPPPAPTLISPCNITRNTNGMVMDWNDSVDEMGGPVSYIYQSARDEGFLNIAYTSTSLSTSQIPAPGTPEGEYWWHVKACDTSNNCSDWSSFCRVLVDNTAPTLPGQIGWTNENPPIGSDYTGGTDFDRYQTCGGVVNYSPMTNLWGPATDNYGPITYDREVYNPTDSNLIYGPVNLSTNYQNGGGAVDGQTYWVRIRAKDAAGNTSTWSPKCAITYDITPPLNPTFYVEEDANEVKIDWLAVSDAVGYKIYRSSDNITYSEIANLGIVTTYTDTSLTSNSDYYYKVTAYDLAGNESNLLAVNGKYSGTMDVVIDDDAMNTDHLSSGTVSKTGSWGAYSMNNYPSILQNAVGGDNWGTDYNPVNQTYTWLTNTTLNGYYVVYAQYICDPARNVASYEVFGDATSLGTGILDQRLLSDQLTACPSQSSISQTGPMWAKIGSYSFENQTAKVTLNAGSNPGYILADAIGFKKVEDTVKPTSIITTGLNILGTNINNPDNDNDASGYHNHTINLVHWNGSIDGTAQDNIGGTGVKRVILSIQRVRLVPYFNGYWDGGSWVSGGTEETMRVVTTGTNTWSYQLSSHPTGTYIIKSHAVDNANNIENTYTLILTNEDEMIEEEPTIAPTAVLSPQLDLSLSEDKKKVKFSIENITGYQLMTYELTYKTFNIDRGIVGNDIDISKLLSYEKETDLATCSSGVCTYDENVSGLKINVILKDSEDKETVINKMLE